jgi:choice-of-anchor B domain-containing protein
MKKILLFVFLFASITSNAQTKPLKANLLGIWHDSTIVSSFYNVYNEVWGLSVKGKEYGVIGSTDGMHIIDIDAKPFKELFRIMGAATGTSIIHRDYDEYKGYLYGVGDQGNATLQIVDIRNLPKAAKVVYDSDSLFSTCHNTFIDTLTGKLYAMGIRNKKKGINQPFAVYDVKTNPAVPKLLWDSGTIGNLKIGYVHDGYMVRDTAYLNCGNQGLVIASFKDPANPVLLGTLSTYKFSGYNHSSYLTEDSKYLVLADETHGMPLKMVNVKNMNDIFVESTFSAESSPTQIPHNPLVRGKYVYTGYYYDGLTVHDISNPKAPKLVMHYDECTTPDAAGFSGAWGVYPLLPSKRILLADMQRGLHVFDGIEKTLLTANRETEVSQLDVQVFPQPADDILTISIQNNIGLDKIDVQLFDMQGKRIKQFKNMDLVNGKQSLLLDIQDITNGIYLLSILENGKVQNRKVVVQR